MLKAIENILKTLIILLVPCIGFLYWLAFGYGNHINNLITLLTYNL